MVAVWHPESKNKDPKKVGKQGHLDFLIAACETRGKGKIGKGNTALFDDDENNIKVGAKMGYQMHFCKALSGRQEGPSGFNRDVWIKFVEVKGVNGGGCVLM
jgi:hypothetical protein